MSRVVYQQPSLLGGVSQQPAVLRLPNQCERQTNFVPSPVEGLYKRHGTRWVASIDSGVPPNTGPARLFPIHRDNQEKYLLLAQNDTLRVFDIDGIEYPVYGDVFSGGTIVPPDFAYITGTAPSKLKVLNVADYTFILNPERAVSEASSPIEEVDDLITHAYVSVLQGQYSCDYKVTLKTDNTVYPSETYFVRTWDGDTVNAPTKASTYEIRFPTSGYIGDVGDSWSFDFTKHDGTSGTVAFQVQPAGSTWFQTSVWTTMKEFTNKWYIKDQVYISGFQISGGNVVFRVKAKNEVQSGGSTPWNLDIALSSGGKPASAVEDFGIVELQEPQVETLESIQTEDIAALIAEKINTQSSVFVAENIDHVVRITGPVDLTSIDLDDSYSGQLMSACDRRVESIDQLPTRCYNGYGVRVMGANKDNEDDYWVRFSISDILGVEHNDAGSGVWDEGLPLWPFGTNTSQSHLALFTDNMPHQLVRRSYLGSIYFTFEQPDWAQREVGDSVTNPFPGFTGGTIDDIVFHRNRLGLLAQERIVFSEVGSYFNFWRTTVRQLLDSDPVDIASNLRGVINFEHAAELDGDLVLLSDKTQCRLEAEPVLGPTTATIRKMLELQVDTERGPESVGRGLMVPFLRGGYGGFHEIYRTDEINYDYYDITEQVPHYLDGQVVDIAASVRDGVAVVLTASGSLYLYSFFTRGREKVQSAWSEIATENEILGVAFFDSDLYLTIRDGDQVNIYTIPFSASYRHPDGDLPWSVRLDRLHLHLGDGSYDPITKLTTAPFPFAVDASETGWWAVNVDTGEASVVTTDVSNPSNPLLIIQGDWSGLDFWVGKSFNCLYDFGEILLRETSGERITGVTSGRTQVLDGVLTLRDSGYASVVVSDEFGASSTYFYTGPELGTGFPLANLSRVQDDEFWFPVRGLSTETSIVVESDSYLPLNIVGARWTIDFTTHARPFRS